jgi:hypothetical protein
LVCFDEFAGFAEVEAQFQQVTRPGVEAEAKACLEHELAAAQQRARQRQVRGAAAEYCQARRREEDWLAHQHYHKVMDELNSEIGIGLRFMKWTRDNADWIRSQKIADLEKWKAGEVVGSWFYCLCELDLARLEESAEVKKLKRTRGREAVKRQAEAEADAKRKVWRLIDARKAFRLANAAFGDCDRVNIQN